MQESKANDYRLWLHPATSMTSTSVADNIPQLSFFSDDDYTIWLHPDSFASTTKSTSNKISELPSVFSGEDYRKWLHPESLTGAHASKDVANYSFKFKNFNPNTPGNGFNFKDSLMTTNSASNSGNIWLASSPINKSSAVLHSGLSVSDALKEIRQTSGKLAQIQNGWDKWLNR